MLSFIKEYWFLVNGLLIPIATYFIGKYKELKKKDKKVIEEMELLKEGVCTLQRNSLYKTCEDYLMKGYCSINAKATVSSLYESYHSLGGDSFITDMVDRVLNLPLIPPAAA